MKKNNKKIAIVGARGIANYGGFESFVREIATRLTDEGYDVYCSSEKEENLINEYKGVNLTYFPFNIPADYGIRRKILLLCYKAYFAFYFSICKECDIVYFLGSGQSIFTILPRLFKRFTIVNMGGVEWNRSKFSKLEKFILKTNFKLALISTNNMIIDNKGLANHIDKKYHHKLIYIPYGADINLKNSKWDEKIANQYIKNDYKVYPNEYWLIVTRLSPDNNVHIVLEAFIKSNSKKPLIVIGSLSASSSYCFKISEILKANKDKKIIIFAGGIYNQDHLNMFRNNCFGYIHAHSIGGTNPSLLESMYLKNIIIAHDNKFNNEVCRDSAIYFKDADELAQKIEIVDKGPEKFSPLADKVYERVLKYYSWEKIVEEYLNILGG